MLVDVSLKKMPFSSQMVQTKLMENQTLLEGFKATSKDIKCPICKLLAHVDTIFDQ